MTDVRCIWEAGAALGEGPLWAAREAALYWVDIKGAVIHRYDPASEARRSWHSGQTPGSLQLAAGGRFVGVFRNGFHWVRFDGDRLSLEPIIDPEPTRRDNRFNDGKVGPDGGYWAGSMDDGEADSTGALYRLAPDLSCRRIDDGIVITNGPAFSPDGRRLYHTDTLAGTVFAFDLGPDGALDNKRAFIRIDPADGHPDGMTVDAEGCLWLCHFGGWRISRFDPDGGLCGRIDLPVAQVTSCTFGGTDLQDLYITTAAKGLDEAALAKQPLAGGLFHCRPGATGLPTPEFMAAAAC